MRTEQDTVELSWSSPASNAPPVAGYEVFFAENGSDVTQSAGTTTTTTISVTLPTLGVLYHFFVVAFSDMPNSLPSARSNYLNTGKYNFQHLGAMICVIEIFLKLK